MSGHLGAWAWFVPGALVGVFALLAGAWRFAARITRWSDTLGENTRVTRKLAKSVRSVQKQTDKIPRIERELGDLGRRVGDLEGRG